MDWLIPVGTHRWSQSEVSPVQMTWLLHCEGETVLGRHKSGGVGEIPASQVVKTESLENKAVPQVERNSIAQLR